LARELEHLAEKKLGRERLSPTIEVDAEIPLKDITYEMVHQINALSPFGEGNPEPLFLARTLEVLGAWVIGEKHLKIKVRQDGKTFDAIGFNLAERRPHDGKAIDMLFTPELNNWQTYEKIQLRIRDLEFVT
jgi:single-stranded-DNA-specific exonuclease